MRFAFAVILAKNAEMKNIILKTIQYRSGVETDVNVNSNRSLSSLVYILISYTDEIITRPKLVCGCSCVLKSFSLPSTDILSAEL